MNNLIAKTAVTLGIFIVIAATLYFAFAARNAGQNAVFVEGLTLAEGIEQGQATGKPVFVLALATWCPHCQSLDRQALAKESVQDAIQKHTIPVRYNISARKIDPEAWPEIDRLGVKEVPTMLLLDPSWREIDRLTGVIDAEALEAWITSAGQQRPSETGQNTKIGRTG